MATILLAQHEVYVPTRAACSLSVVTDDATDQVLDVEVTNALPLAFTATITSVSGGAAIERTIAADSGTQRLPAGQRNALQARGLTLVQTHGQAMLQTAAGRNARISATLTPNE